MANSRQRALRLLHTSDWHLGIDLGTQSRQADHVAALDSLVSIAADFAPDAIVHTGDLFHHPRPGADDQALAVHGLRRLSELAPVVVIGGNHDNNPMLDNAWDTLASFSGVGRVRFRGRTHLPGDGGVIVIPADEGRRRILVCAVPFLTAHSFARFDRPGETTVGYRNGMRRIRDTYNEWLASNADPESDKVIWATHLLVAGARPAGSERLVGPDDFATSTTEIPPVSYAAFGHIHIAQKLPGDAVVGRYAGGMLPFRFDEAREEAEPKSVVLVELPATGVAKCELAPLEVGRRLVELTATLDELPAHAEQLKDCFVRVTVPLDGPLPGLAMRVTEALPDSTIIQVIPSIAVAGRATPDAERTTSGDLGALLEQWLAEHELIGADADRSAGIVRAMIVNAQARRRESLEGERLLDADIATDLSEEIVTALEWDDLETQATAAELVDALAEHTDGGDGFRPATEEGP